jgi:hypothetical protein
MKEGHLGWVAVSAVLIIPVALYQYESPMGRESPGVRPALVPHPFIHAAPKPDFAPPASVEPPPAPPVAVEPAPIVLARDPTLSPLDLMRIAEAARPKPAPEASAPAKPRPPRLKPITLEAIIQVESQRPRAIVNGRLMQEGESQGDLKLLRIGDDSATFSRGGKKVVRTLGR